MTLQILCLFHSCDSSNPYVTTDHSRQNYSIIPVQLSLLVLIAHNIIKPSYLTPQVPIPTTQSVTKHSRLPCSLTVQISIMNQGPSMHAARPSRFLDTLSFVSHLYISRNAYELQALTSFVYSRRTTTQLNLSRRFTFVSHLHCSFNFSTHTSPGMP